MLRQRQLATALVLTAMLTAASPAAATAPPDDVLPGTPLPPSVVSDSLDAATDPRDCYHVALTAGETLQLSLSTDSALATADCDLDIYLYGPGAAPGVPSQATAVAKADLPLYYPETLSYRAPATGTYYIELSAFRGSGPAHLTWAILPEPLLPVYRFYNLTNGSHFFTDSTAECEIVRTRWSHIYRDEGVAYCTKASRNTQPLYRFYNRVSGSHFYTASDAEAAAVQATWPHIFTLDGRTYSVNPGYVAGSIPVFRFYNVRNGSHFYTASVEEANAVTEKWGYIYRFEGPAFYLGQ